MADASPKDYLGHPCRIAAAFDSCSESVSAARKSEPHDLVRDIGVLLHELILRDQHLGQSLELARDVVASDSDQVEALLEMAIPYNLESSNKLNALAGKVIVALERAQMLEADTAEYVTRELSYG